jgi:biotin carboxylase
MRDIFQAHGLPTVPHGTACCVDEGLSVARRIGYPVVIKPLLAGGSVFIRRVESDGELSEVFDGYMQGGIQRVANDPLVRMTVGADASPRILIEKLIGGKTKFETSLPLPVGEVSIEGCVVDGSVHVLGFHDKPLPANGPHYEEVLWSTPTRLSPEWQEELRDLARRTLASIGLEYGIFHLETRTTDEGPVILEVAARMGGGPIYRSIRESSGIDMIEIMYRIATRQEVGDELLRPSRKIPVMTFGFFAPEGELLSIQGLEEVRRHPNVIEAAIYEYPGTYIHRAPRSDHCTVHVMVRADSHAEAEDIGRWAEETIKFESQAK